MAILVSCWVLVGGTSRDVAAGQPAINRQLVAPGRTAASPRGWSQLCAARPTSSITQALARGIPPSLGEVQVNAISPDGMLLYVNVRGELSAAGESGFRGLEVVNHRTWSVLARMPLPARPEWAAPALTAGPWFVWMEYYSDSNLDRFTVHAWDPATGQARQVGSSVAGWQSPLQSPAYSGIYAAWVSGDGPGLVDKVTLANLRTGRDRVVYQGHALEPFFEGNLLVWPQQAVPAGPSTLVGVSLRTDKPAVLPPALRGVHAANTIVTAEGQVAYVLGPDYDDLYYSASLDRPAHVVLRTAIGTLEDVHLGIGWLAWTGTATYLANTKTGAYVQVTPAFGAATGNASDTVAVVDYAGKTSVTPQPRLLDASRLVWRRC